MNGQPRFDWVAAVVDDYVKGRMTLKDLLHIVEATGTQETPGF